MQPSK